MSIRNATLAIVAIALLVTAALIGAPIQVDASPSPQMERSITVTGFGSVVGMPDIAYLSLGVNSSDQDITAALNDNNQRIEAVKAVLIDNGVAAEDIRTEYFNIYHEKGYPPEISGPTGDEGQAFYRINHVLYVVVRNPDNLADLLGTAVEAGANTVNSASFDIADRSTLEAEARIKALNDARDRAQQLADELGVELGEAMSVTERGNFYGSPEYASGVYGGGGGGAAPPISQGSLTVRMALEVSFTIN